MRGKQGPRASGVGRLVIAGYFLFGVANLLIGVYDVQRGDPWSAFPAVVAGAALAVMGFHLRLLYRLGWQWGRRELVTSMEEAQRRGLSPREWMIAEIERTELGELILRNHDEQ